MTNYYFRHTNIPHIYTCAKFLPDDSIPVDIYNVRLEQHRIRGKLVESFACSCPTYKLDCKHVKYLREWFQIPSSKRVGSYFDDTTNTWEKDALADSSDFAKDKELKP